jgi:hypothetical protein
MLDRLRTPVFVIAAIVFLLVVLAELGTSLLPATFDEGRMRAETERQLGKSDLSGSDRRDVADHLIGQARRSDKPPGAAIPAMALLDGILLYTVLLMGFALILPERVQGRLQGTVGLIVSILVILTAIILFFKTFIQLMMMVSLFLAVPFGTLAYLAVWGFFNRAGADTVLGVLMVLKLAFIVLLLAAHQHFLQNKGLLFLIVTTLAMNFVIVLLHGLVPIFLVSITDAVAALIAIALACIWAVLLLITSVMSIVKAIF